MWYMYLFIHIFIGGMTYTNIYIIIYIYIGIWHEYWHIYTHIYIYIYIYIYMYIHVHTCDTCIYIYIYIHQWQIPLWLERQRGLSRSTEAEENGHIAGPQGAFSRQKAMASWCLRVVSWLSILQISWDITWYCGWVQNPKSPVGYYGWYNPWNSGFEWRKRDQTTAMACGMSIKHDQSLNGEFMVK